MLDIMAIWTSHSTYVTQYNNCIPPAYALRLTFPSATPAQLSHVHIFLPLMICVCAQIIWPMIHLVHKSDVSCKAAIHFHHADVIHKKASEERDRCDLTLTEAAGYSPYE